MRALTNSEKRTIRLAGIGIALYLALFCGYKFWKSLERKREEYLQLVAEAGNLRADVRRHEARIAHVKKLMEEFHLDPAKLSRTNIVAQTSSAIQRAAQSGGVQLGPIRESAARSSSQEIASIQLEGSGPVSATMALLQRINTCGYPVIIDTVQFNADPMRPGQMKFNLTLVILDFEQWKLSEAPHA